MELYYDNNTFVSTDVVEFDGQKYDPKELINVFVMRHDEYGGIFKGGAIAIIGIIILLNGGGGFGTLLLLFGGIWCAKKFYDNQDEKVFFTVSPSFSGGRHTGKADEFTVHIQGNSEARRLEKALWLANEGEASEEK